MQVLFKDRLPNKVEDFMLRTMKKSRKIGRDTLVKDLECQYKLETGYTYEK